MSQRVHIVIEDGRVEILINDGESVVVSSSPETTPAPVESTAVDQDDDTNVTIPPQTSPQAKEAAERGLEIAEFVANAPVDDTQHVDGFVQDTGGLPDILQGIQRDNHARCPQQPQQDQEPCCKDDRHVGQAV